jgi:hypothetical protein
MPEGKEALHSAVKSGAETPLVYFLNWQKIFSAF